MASTLEKQYQKKTDKEHILDNPDTYIGSIENVNGESYVFQDGKVKSKVIDFNPALFKLFDEGIVNCRDHVIRMNTLKQTIPETDLVTDINVTIDNNKITMTNNGNGIDVEKHPTYDVWIPELIFGHLRTSTNYNKDEEKITGGKNGFGFKLVLIWSTYGRIETVDKVRGLKYSQVFENNLDVIHKPSVVKSKVKPYTTVEFIPDYKRLGLKELTPAMISLFQRRVYDIAGITEKTVKVKLNGELIKSNDFNKYIELYTEQDKIYETSDPRWTYCVCLSDEFRQVSFVNGIFTGKGGKHVDYILGQITKKMIAFILKKKKVEVKASIIKEQITLFVNCTVVNPAFDSQTKDYLNTPYSKFGSTCVVSDKFIEKLAKLGIMENSCNLSNIKEKNNSKKTDGNKNKNIQGIPKLVDANYAGTKNSKLTTLILCEGDSAKAGILSGLATKDRNVIGVYPLKGKLLNVRGETLKSINDNKEITEIKKIMGLTSNQVYTNTDTLRYGKILFMTDQDLDGSHIKGLCINMFDCLWPSLLQLDGFLGFMNTPILKATRNKTTTAFYNENDYEQWKSEHNNGDGWKIKYYKGLGTSTGAEFKEYFTNKKIMNLCVVDNDRENLDMVFNKAKEKATLRKSWLGKYDRTDTLNLSKVEVTLSDFVNKEMIHFSKYDCDRSIPNLMDGLKTSQRKILYSAFKKNLTTEIKVAQFSGYVSENSGYHHGENSLNGAIINLAQNYVGSNNINLLIPSGQFGTRLNGGKDHAAERYIFTYLNKITRHLFVKEDDAVLNYLNDDGTLVEPQYYVPIIPLILVNGSKGIGTGFSTDIPSYNPLDVITYIERELSGEEHGGELVPYYKGFKGTITKEDTHQYMSHGKYSLSGTKLSITELPIHTWTDDYKKFLEKCIVDGKIKDYNDMSTDTDVTFDITLKATLSTEQVEKEFKLKSTISTTNLHLFNQDDTLIKYDSADDICDDFIKVRLDYYEQRRVYLLQKLNDEKKVLKNKYKYINELLDDTIDLRKKTTDVINKLLEDKQYMKIDDSFKYLTKMSMDCVCEENVESLKLQYNTKKAEIKKIEGTTNKEMWLHELAELRGVL
jgi:DNA topoisomerase II